MEHKDFKSFSWTTRVYLLFLLILCQIWKCWQSTVCIFKILTCGGILSYGIYSLGPDRLFCLTRKPTFISIIRKCSQLPQCRNAIIRAQLDVTLKISSVWESDIVSQFSGEKYNSKTTWLWTIEKSTCKIYLCVST